MKPIIAVTAGIVPNRDEPWAPETQGQSHTYIEQSCGLAIGVQSHPESLDERAEVLWQKFFAALTDAAKK
jgi:hypothetical protein